jgi:hypothetical protein
MRLAKQRQRRQPIAHGTHEILAGARAGNGVRHVRFARGGDQSGELQRNLQEVVSMLLEDGEPKLESEFVGVQTIKVA